MDFNVIPHCYNNLILVHWFKCFIIILLKGNPIFKTGWSPYNSLNNLLKSKPRKPTAAFTSDPFWYDLGDLKPFVASVPENYLPSSLRDSFLSPVKKDFVWKQHPMRPFGEFNRY